MTVKRRRSMCVVCCLLLAMAINPRDVSAGFPEDYDKALKTFQSAKVKGDYENAARLFTTLSLRKDAGTLYANTLYWLAESWYGLKEYVQALNGFEKVLLIPRSNKEEAARFKVGVCYARLGWNESARWELSRFLRDYPSSSLVGVVRKELGKLPAAAPGK